MSRAKVSKKMRALLFTFALVTSLALFIPGAPLEADSNSDSVLLLLSDSGGQSALDPQVRLSPVLYSLRAHKLINGFEWLREANAIKVNGVTSSAAQTLASLPGVTRVTPVRAEILDAARRLHRQQLTNTYRRALHPAERLSTPSDLPYFEINETWDLLQAKNLTAGQAVTAVLKDSGASVKDTLNVNADGAGMIQANFAADVVQGDSVDITYNATTVTIVSVPITIEFDFANDHITGTAKPDEAIFVNARDDGAGWCAHHEYFIESATTVGGTFDVNLSGSYDVIRRTEVNVTSTDENDNGWTVWRHAPWILLRPMPGQTNGQGSGLAPDEDINLTLMNGATVKESQTSHTNYPDAGFGFGFGQSDMLPGDTFEATENSNTWASIPIIPLTAQLNAGTGQITGQAPANESVIVRTDHYNRTTGEWQNSCQTVIANGSGAYSATTSTTLIGNDSVNAFYVDADGFEHQVWDLVPFLQPNKGTSLLQGSFKTNFDGEMDITVKNKKGVLKYQGKGYAFGGWFNQTLAASGAPVVLAAKDAITVKPKAGTLAPEVAGTLTATVAPVNLTLDVGSNSISGTAPKNSHVGLFGQKWWGNGYECRNDCWFNLAVDGTGTVSHTFNQDLVAGDYAEILSIDAKGNYTYQRAFSTNPTLTMNSFPATFRQGRPNQVTYTVANGVHVDDTFVAFDATSRPDWRYIGRNGPEGNWYPGGPGAYDVNVWIAHQGKIFFRAFAHVDGRWIYTDPESVAKAR